MSASCSWCVPGREVTPAPSPPFCCGGDDRICQRLLWQSRGLTRGLPAHSRLTQDGGSWHLCRGQPGHTELRGPAVKVNLHRHSVSRRAGVTQASDQDTCWACGSSGPVGHPGRDKLPLCEPGPGRVRDTVSWSWRAGLQIEAWGGTAEETCVKCWWWPQGPLELLLKLDIHFM